MVMIPGVSSQEAKVMDWIVSMLPKGQDHAIRKTTSGSRWLGRPHILFVAHADELA
jgi:putative aminopeptidase FrvX